MIQSKMVACLEIKNTKKHNPWVSFESFNWPHVYVFNGGSKTYGQAVAIKN